MGWPLTGQIRVILDKAIPVRRMMTFHFDLSNYKAVLTPIRFFKDKKELFVPKSLDNFCTQENTNKFQL